ncbi:MAG: nitroreductase [Deltaproteobacteria bacterium]|nr:nitroreductase [Deltaproteobacteria bacterium]
MTLIETIQARRSCRTYDGRSLEGDAVAQWNRFLASNTEGPFGGGVRFRLLALDELGPEELSQVGTYGVIKDPRHFIIGAVATRPQAMEDFGYCMEKNILQATAGGLATCWLAGTFRRSGFARLMPLREGEVLPAVSPLGHAGESRSLTDRFFRFSAGSDKRKPWAELFFDGTPDTPLSPATAGPFATPLECVRLAPSASNKQPWRIVRVGEDYHFYLSRTPGYEKFGKDIQLQNMDMGIALCHFELSAKELGLNGAWRRDASRRAMGDWEYIVTWVTTP